MKEKIEYYHYDMLKEALLKLGESSHDVRGFNYIIDNINYENVEIACGKENYSEKGIESMVIELKKVMSHIDYKIECNEYLKNHEQKEGTICPICEQKELFESKYERKELICTYCGNTFPNINY